MKADTAARKREQAQVEVREAAAAVLRYEDELDAAIAHRNRVLIRHHGDKRQGKLSYEDLATATAEDPRKRISKGRVIQIVQGKSRYSKQQRVAAGVAPPGEE